MKWNVTYSSYDELLDVTLVVEQEGLSGLWFFNVQVNGNTIVYRGTADKPTAEEAMRTAEIWYEQGEYKVRRTTEKQFQTLEWIGSYWPDAMALPDGNPSQFLREAVAQGDVLERHYPDGGTGYEVTDQGLLKLKADLCPECGKQLYGAKVHPWHTVEYKA